MLGEGCRLASVGGRTQARYLELGKVGRFFRRKWQGKERDYVLRIPVNSLGLAPSEVTFGCLENLLLQHSLWRSKACLVWRNRWQSAAHRTGVMTHSPQGCCGRDPGLRHTRGTGQGALRDSSTPRPLLTERQATQREVFSPSCLRRGARNLACRRSLLREMVAAG